MPTPNKSMDGPSLTHLLLINYFIYKFLHRCLTENTNSITFLTVSSRSIIESSVTPPTQSCPACDTTHWASPS